MNAVAAWILDASAAIKWYLRDENLLGQADAILRDFTLGRHQLVAPAYFRDEMANILRSAVYRGRLSAVDARRSFGSLFSLDIAIIEPTFARQMTALDLAIRFEIAYYDALYVQLVDELRLPLITDDRPLHARIAGTYSATLIETL